MIFKENLTEILDGIRPFLLPLNSYSSTGGKKRGAENRTVSVSVSEASHKSEVVRNDDFGRRKLNLWAPKTMVFRRGKLTERNSAENRQFTHTEIWSV